MTDISSVASSAVAMVAKQTADLGKAANAATTSFESALSKVKSTIVGRPKTGFASGPTYEAGTLTGQTKAAFNNTINAAKSALNIKP
jgi:uncharacterized membrane protein